MEIIDLSEGTQSLSPQQAKEIGERIRADREQAPSVRLQSASYRYFQEQLNTLGTPYDVTHIPISVLEQMQRDPMIGFGLHFIKTPLMRARWHIQCEDAQVAAFVDNALRIIYPRYVQQRCQSLSFGYTPLVKRFTKDQPDWTYLDPSKSDDELKVWDEGNVDAIIWKHFVALPSKPNIAEPNFNAKGEFDGIKYTSPAGTATVFPFQSASSPDEEGTRDIPARHSLWITNERDTVMGSLWGFPRIAYAYRYWWSYWFRWALYDRYFERKADPPYEIYYPSGASEGDYTKEDDETVKSMKQVALQIAEGAKSGGIVAMPNTTMTGYDDRPTTIREWELKELEIKGDLTNFVESFEYLDVMKLRAMFIPEQAFLEGKGGSSSRNVASEEIDIFKESEAVIAEEIDEEINRYVIPDIVATNFPEKQVTARKVTTGFTEADKNTMQEILRVLGTADASALQNVDLPELLDRLGVPRISHAELRRREQRVKEELEANPPLPDPSAPAPGVAGVTEQGLYVQPRGQITLGGFNLSDDSDFVASLPPTRHYEDKAVISSARGLRRLWKSAYEDIYEDFASYIGKTKLSEDINLAEEDDEAEKIVSKWEYSRKKVQSLLSDSLNILQKVIKTAGTRELRRARLKPDWKPDSETIANFLDERGAEQVVAVDETTRNELKSFLASQIREGNEAGVIAQAVRENFADYPSWKASRLVRSEIRNAYNFATLEAGEQVGLSVVQARDAQAGDSDPTCIKRNGKFFKIPEAIKETFEEHPNGTLEWVLTKRKNLSTQYVDEMPEHLGDTIASFDDDTETVYLKSDISLEDQTNYLLQLGAVLENE